MTDIENIEKLLQTVCKRALVEFSRVTKRGMCDLDEGQLVYDIDGITYAIDIARQDDATQQRDTENFVSDVPEII